MSTDAMLLDELHLHESRAFPAALCEAIRLLESERFGQLTDADIREVANYRTITLDGAEFFARAFTPGKEAAASLGLARLLGRERVLDDLLRLRAALGCECGAHREREA
jgi:hypothetical protein